MSQNIKKGNLELKMNTKKLMDEMKKKGRPLNIGIKVGKKNPKIDYYCDKCQEQISHNQYKMGKGLCKACMPKAGFERMIG